MNEKTPKLTIIHILLLLSVVANLVLGFIALDRTIRVNELVGDNFPTSYASDRPSYPKK